MVAVYTFACGMGARVGALLADGLEDLISRDIKKEGGSVRITVFCVQKWFDNLPSGICDCMEMWVCYIIINKDHERDMGNIPGLGWSL